ncbi:hypothetical protein T439DRAFT_360045 [Meredithblackwellia eburnea MCA 4105]
MDQRQLRANTPHSHDHQQTYTQQRTASTSSRAKGWTLEPSTRRLLSLKLVNVTFTRAKLALVVVGDPSTLEKDEVWRRFLEFIKS